MIEFVMLRKKMFNKLTIGSTLKIKNMLVLVLKYCLVKEKSKYFENLNFFLYIYTGYRALHLKEINRVYKKDNNHLALWKEEKIS